MAKKSKQEQEFELAQEQRQKQYNATFANLRGAIEEMYSDDRGIKNAVQASASGSASTITASTSVANVKSTYFNTNNLKNIRQLSREAYALFPQYRALIDSWVNSFYWRYTYVPRQVKDTTSGDYVEMYNLMADVVDGLSLETMTPTILTKLLIDGSIYLYCWKRNSSKTITTIFLPADYCRTTTITQYGTLMYQFDMSYFDSLGLSDEQLEAAWETYPKEFRSLYEAYKEDTTNAKWANLDARYAACFSTSSDIAIPMYLHSLMSVLRYNQYQDNELEHSNQQLERIITHQLPVWQDQLVVQVPEMKALHKGMVKALASNKHVRLMTSFGSLGMLSVSRDQSKENKTLSAAHEAIYDDAGFNSSLFVSDTKEAVDAALRRMETIVWRYVQQIIKFYNITINNSFNFRGYQCDLTMLPLSVYNFSNQLLQYKEGATLGVSKLEYIVALGTRQIDIAAKVALEDHLQLDKLKPLSTSYTTSGANASGKVTEQTPTEGDGLPEEDVQDSEEEIQAKSEVNDEI